MPKRIGLFGGSFDPVHLGHLLVAQAAREEVALDRIYFLPAAESPFKPGRQLAPGSQRLGMLRLALAGQSHAEVDSQEIERGGISYTIDTVRQYQTCFPGSALFYIIGADQVPQLPKWRQATELAKALEFLVVPRPGEATTLLPAGFRGRLLVGFPLGISSSQIRSRVTARQEIDVLTRCCGCGGDPEQWALSLRGSAA